jgi:tetratricopeptide (TPR) repeat protein
MELQRAFQPGSEGTALENLGEIALKTGDIETADRLFREALQLFESSGFDVVAGSQHHPVVAQMIAHVRGNLSATAGEAARLRGDTAEAQRHFEEALAIFAELGTPYNHYARDYEDFVRERLADLPEAPPTNGPLPAEQTSSVAAATGATRESHGRRRWWLWGQK